jgi:trk system potassium uptake protein TrkH
LFKLESFETFDSAFNKVKSIAVGILLIYSVITLIVMLLLIYVAKLNFFDSIIHSFTSVSTAGFSNKNTSVAYFNNPIAEIILMGSMIIGGMPYILLYYFIFLRKVNLFSDAQVLGYLKTLIVVVGVLCGYLYFHNGLSIFDSFRFSAFSSVSLLTGTGFINSDYTLFGYFPTMMLFFVMFIGGCGGSTACGIKIYRFQIAYHVLKSAVDKLFLNKHISVSYYNNKIITADISVNIFVAFHH